jgi:Type I phosphodiesterase / nucleotide pyrophosphatase
LYPALDEKTYEVPSLHSPDCRLAAISGRAERLSGFDVLNLEEQERCCILDPQTNNRKGQQSKEQYYMCKMEPSIQETATDLTPSIAAFRIRVQSILESEANGLRRHIVILGIDGIPYDLALNSWRYARTEKMRSVFPTTSSTAWLSSLTGMDVDSHGIPGVLFEVSGSRDLINVFEYKGPIGALEIENIFSDAIRFGYLPLSILGDLEDFDCSWRHALLRHSQPVGGYKFYTRSDKGAPPHPTIVCRDIRRAILQALHGGSRSSPCLIWCFVDVDRYIHYNGYDEHVSQLLTLIEETAVNLADNTIVLAHSDHGLTRTTHDVRIEQLMERLRDRLQCLIGGAGRTRWLYLRREADRQAVLEELGRHLPRSVRVCGADDLFAPGSLSRSRVGEIVLVAEGEEFLVPSGYRFEHGSLTAREVHVPLSEWQS